MSRGTKRKKSDEDASIPENLPKSIAHSVPVKRDLLARLYPRCVTLREYVLHKLPKSSKIRRRKIQYLGLAGTRSELENSLCQLLDTSLVCYADIEDHTVESRWSQWLSFSQRADDSNVTLSGTSSGFCQSEIVDFVIWRLFSKGERGAVGPKHVLCDGFRRQFSEKTQPELIPGVFSRFPNNHVAMVKSPPWPELLALLGRSGERIMIGLLVDCSIFLSAKSGLNNYYQICGFPLSELEVNSAAAREHVISEAHPRKLSEITLVRNRMFYARPSLTAKGRILMGLKHIHVFNRCSLVRQRVSSTAEKLKSDAKNDLNTTKVLMYIFPRQFGLHNVFTSTVDASLTMQKFQDYTLREEEITNYLRASKVPQAVPKIPKRLRGLPKTLTHALLVRHGRCSYFELLKHYCPTILDGFSPSVSECRIKFSSGNARDGNQQSGSASAERNKRKAPKSQSHGNTQLLDEVESCPIVELATPIYKVSSFVQAAVLKVIPSAFWGTGDDGEHNKSLAGQKIQHFIALRRYESTNLHDLLQGFKLSNLAWAQHPDQKVQKPSRTESNKRQEILLEFLYYVFDSFVIPLIRSCFYVTESNSHRYQVFYFRHDIWRLVCERAMSTIKSEMLEEFKPKAAHTAMEGRQLGYSHIRLLPKGNKLRPIMNLRRRYMSKLNARTLVPSINTVLAPIYNMLKLEKATHPLRLRSTLFSVGDIYKKLKTFKSRLGKSHTKLYFAKLDVQSAFDTIPQDAVLRLMCSVPSQPNYKVVKHAEVKPGEQSIRETAQNTAAKPIKRWTWAALPSDDVSPFSDRLESQLGGQRKNTVFINSAAQKQHHTRALLMLLIEHVKENLIKVGKKYYRQKRGIPQGSVLSSFLCNYFYADLEMRHLAFVDSPDCLLLRLIDDFLLITLDKAKAERFVDVMHGGLPEYGVQVNQQKSLVNFTTRVNGEELPRIPSEAGFPYCGTLINCKTLDISKDVDRDRAVDISHTLTVEYGRNPGQSFERKVLHAFKIQSHLMLYDTSHNSIHTVLTSLRDAFTQTALKMWAYIRSLGGQNRSQRIRPNLVIRAIGRTIEVAHLVLTSRFRKMKHEGYTCSLRKSQIASVAYDAFEQVLERKQTGYAEVLNWLREEARKLKK